MIVIPHTVFIAGENQGIVYPSDTVVLGTDGINRIRCRWLLANKKNKWVIYSTKIIVVVFKYERLLKDAIGSGFIRLLEEGRFKINKAPLKFNTLYY